MRTHRINLAVLVASLSLFGAALTQATTFVQNGSFENVSTNGGGTATISAAVYLNNFASPTGANFNNWIASDTNKVSTLVGINVAGTLINSPPPSGGGSLYVWLQGNSSILQNGLAMTNSATGLGQYQLTYYAAGRAGSDGNANEPFSITLGATTLVNSNSVPDTSTFQAFTNVFNMANGTYTLTLINNGPNVDFTTGFDLVQITYLADVVPEPSTVMLLGVGAGIVWLRRRFNRQSA